MKKYKIVKQALFLQAGTLELTDAQYQSRKRVLTRLKKKCLYEAIGEVCFKVGEVIGLPQSMIKGIIKTGAIEEVEDK